MIKSYDFIINAYHDYTLRAEIIKHIDKQGYSEMIFQNALLKFDYVNRKIIELPYNSSKVWEMEIGYDDFISVMNSSCPTCLIKKFCKFL